MAMVAGFMTLNAQTVLFEDGFEDYEDFAIANVGDWTLTDVDASTTYGFTGIDFPNAYDPMAYIVFNSTMTNPVLEPTETSDWTARTGSKAMACIAATSLENDDWLISPAIELGTADNELSFWFKSADATYGYEEFNVLISTTNTDIASFTVLEDFLATETPLLWTEYTTNLDTYAGQTVYIAIQCVSKDQFGFLVDDFSVTTGTMAVSDLDKNIASVYPNPVVDTFNVNLSSKFNANNVSVTVTDLAGRTVKTFGAAASYNVADLASGVYIVKITDGQNTETKKIVKK